MNASLLPRGVVFMLLAMTFCVSGVANECMITAKGQCSMM
jgi:hypothetical protein